MSSIYVHSNGNAKECRLLSSDELDFGLQIKSVFQPRLSELSGHPICYELPLCSSPLRMIRAAATYNPILRRFSTQLANAI